ncbi:MAG: hypothetical protein LBU76_05900 [Azoarcus sp.]|jgi:hypothetical protein|nr:hypothetical protein [Azoarcus sp.]
MAENLAQQFAYHLSEVLSEKDKNRILPDTCPPHGESFRAAAVWREEGVAFALGHGTDPHEKHTYAFLKA